MSESNVNLNTGVIETELAIIILLLALLLLKLDEVEPKHDKNNDKKGNRDMEDQQGISIW